MDVKEVKCLAVISDLHLGDEKCLFNDRIMKEFEGTNETKGIREANEKFYGVKLKDYEELQERRKNHRKELRKKLEEKNKEYEKEGGIEELIILGDFMDLSLAPLHRAFINAKSFFDDLLSGTPPVKKIVLVPGNHDHHLFLQVFEDVLARKFLSVDPLFLPDAREYQQWLVDQDALLQWVGGSSPFVLTSLNELIPKKPPPNLGNEPIIPVEMRYPHVWRKVGNNTYYFTHGHYLEDVFKLISNLFLKTDNLGELETFNMALIEGVWYHLGQAGRLSCLVRDFYHKKMDERAIKGKLRQCVDYILSRIMPGWLKKCGAERLLRGFLTCVVAKNMIKWLEKSESQEELLRKSLSSGLRGKGVDDKDVGVAHYIENVLLPLFPEDKGYPRPFTFIFGHTHTTTGGVEEQKKVPVKVKEGGRIINFPVENTGAWLVEEKRDYGFFLLTASAARPEWVSVPIRSVEE